MKILKRSGREDLAVVYVAQVGEDKSRLVEFIESVQPPVPRDKKWVLIVSTLLGCPVGCAICDAGTWYGGRLSADEILAQILHMVDRRFPDRAVPVPKFKIQFARMGEPSFNPAVLELLDRLPSEIRAPGLLPSLSSVAPAGTVGFFDELIRVKKRRYNRGRFQLQFSIHSTDEEERRRLIPVRTLPFEWMSDYGTRFRGEGDQKITLNFAAARTSSIDPARVRSIFSPEHFLIKLTPVNPTEKAISERIESTIDPNRPATGAHLKSAFEREGFQVILSIGEPEENVIGSNCGMFVSGMRKDRVDRFRAAV